MKIIAKYMRAEEWLNSKVTMMVGILMYFLYLKESSSKIIIFDVCVFFIFVSMFLAISYVANDFSDMEIDKKVGKRKIIATMKKWQIWFSFVIMFAVGNIPLILVCKDKKMTLILIIIVYILGVSYSAPGIRFKERGLVGLVECSFAQRCMPLMLIICLIEMDTWNIFLLMGWMILSFIDGIRYIIIHQIIDIENDKKSGVETYVLKKKRNYRNIIKILLAIEVMMGILVMLPMFMEKPIVMFVGIIISIALEYCIYIVLCKYAKKDWLVSFDSVPLEAYWNMIMPFFVGLCLLDKSIVLILFSVFVFFICRKPLLVKYNIAKIYIKKAKEG